MYAQWVSLDLQVLRLECLSRGLRKPLRLLSLALGVKRLGKLGLDSNRWSLPIDQIYRDSDDNGEACKDGAGELEVEALRRDVAVKGTCV